MSNACFGLYEFIFGSKAAEVCRPAFGEAVAERAGHKWFKKFAWRFNVSDETISMDLHDFFWLPDIYKLGNNIIVI